MTTKELKRLELEISDEDLERFWIKVDIPENMNEGPCWAWESCTGPTGYLYFRFNGKTVSASRLSFEIFLGKLLPGETVAHGCGNKQCVNPYHFKIGTRNQFRKGIKYRKKVLRFKEPPCP